MLVYSKSFVKLLPEFLVVILVMLFFYFLSGYVRKWTTRSISRVSKNAVLQGLFGTIAGLLCLVTGIIISLDVLNLDKTVTSLLAGAGVIGIALGFAFQEIASNFISGIAIAFSNPYRLGDIVEGTGFSGTVIKITLRATHLSTKDGLEVIVPNKIMFTSILTNMTSTPSRRVDIRVGVSYDENLEKVRQVTLKAVENIPFRTPDEIGFFYEEFGDSSINFQLSIWVEYPGDNNFLKARHEIIERLKSAYDEHGICIPYPIRTLNMQNPATIEALK
jgi:small conductance mechanosensitive channel